MKFFKSILFVFILMPILVASQETKKDTIPEKPQRPAFESSYIIDNPTDVLFAKKSMEMHINHRFGLINGGNNDLGGLWAPANIRIGLTYAFFDGWTVGFGTTKFNRLQDFSTKFRLLRQTRSDKVPVNITYYGNFVIDARPKELFDFDTDRFSFFHQVIFSRRFNRNFSMQVAPSISHYNLAQTGMKNDVIGLAVGGRYKVSPQTSILVDYSHPFTNFEEGLNPEPGLSLGVEFSTSGHAFQILISNNNGIVPQKNYMFNQNDFFSGDILIGFNITRVYRF